MHWDASAVCGSTCAGRCGGAASFSANWPEPIADDMKAEFQEFLGRRVYTDVEREGIPPSDADRPPPAPQAVEEEEDRTSALIPTLPPVTSPPPSLPELDSESHRSFREELQSENVLVPSDICTHLDSDRSRRTTSQNFRYQRWSLPLDILSREMEENVQNGRALESVHPMNHPKVPRQLSEDLTRERQSSHQTRERTIERADEKPTKRPRLENSATSTRWSGVDDPRHWVPPTAVEDEEKHVDRNGF